MNTTISNTIQEKLKQIKPHLEEQFGMQITAQAYDIADPAVRRMLLSEMSKNAGRHWREGIEHWREEEEVTASMYPPSIFRGKEYRLLFSSVHLEKAKDVLGSIVCHELLHEIFDERFAHEAIEKLNFVAFPLLSEGFSEYGSLEIFVPLYSSEEEGITLRKKDSMASALEYEAISKEELPLEKESAQTHWERLTSYDAHSLGYVFYREHLGENAGLEKFVDLTTQFSKEERETFNQKIRTFLERYV